MERIYRFGELKKTMPSITQHMLTKQLRELEADGLVNRKVFGEVPPRVEYSLTAKGESLRDIIMKVHQWGKDNIL